MKKNILLLINGFGVEKSDSYQVYTESLMPNMDRLTKERVFFSIPNRSLDYKSAYRNFSIGVEDSLTYNLVENNININEQKSNQLVKYIENETNRLKGRIHIIVYWDSSKTIEQLSSYISELDSNTTCRIFVHLVLCQKSVNDYKDIIKGFNNISYEMGPNVRIGFVTGENNLSNLLQTKDLVKSYITEFGEKWKDLEKKVEVLIQNKTAPCDTRTFLVDGAIKIEDNDQIIFYNYNSIDVSIFKQELLAQKYRPINFETVRFYSLFPVKCGNEQIPFMYNFAVSADYFLNSIKEAKLKCLLMDKRDNCGFINYYLTGLRNSIDDDLKYLPTDDDFIYDGEKLIQTLNTYNDKELIIINYDISDVKFVDDIQDKLHKIDEIIGILDKYIRDNKYALIITSFYGIEREMYNKKSELLKINFSGRSPVVIDDDTIDLGTYTTNEGTLYDLSHTFIWNANREFKETGLLKKKSSLLSIFYKKPKGEKK